LGGVFEESRYFFSGCRLIARAVRILLAESLASGYGGIGI
jgi:hypothetical protein